MEDGKPWRLVMRSALAQAARAVCEAPVFSRNSRFPSRLHRGVRAGVASVSWLSARLLSPGTPPPQIVPAVSSLSVSMASSCV